MDTTLKGPCYKHRQCGPLLGHTLKVATLVLFLGH